MSNFYDKLNSVANEDVAVASPTEYVDGGFGLIPEGTYNIRIVDFEPAFDDVGNFRKRIDLKKVEITGVPEADLKNWLGRSVNNLAIWTTIYKRSGVDVSGLGDLIRGINATQEWESLKDAVDILSEARDKMTNIQVKLIWDAFDKKGFADAGGNAMVKKSQEEKELRKRASVKGMKNFRRTPDDTYLPEVPGPLSGEMLEGRIAVDRVISADRQRSMLT